MGRGLLGILLASTFLLAGCLAPVAPDWGNDISVERSGDGTFTFTSSMSGNSINSDFNERGCSSGDLGADNDGEIKFEGYMSASQIYDSHIADLPDIAYATSAAIAVHSMSFESAKNVRSGEGERVEVKDWSNPVAPKTGAGTANLEKIDGDSDSKWFVLGLIPASENINDGVAALGKYHQPVRITGYLVESEGGGKAIGGIWSGASDIQASSDCVADTGNQNIAQVYVLVTKIELADNVVSLSGDHEDEYTFGDVAVLGRAGFILFVLVVGAGGAVGAYMYSSLRLKMSARSVALTLLGKEGVEKAAQVRKDVAEAKKSGTYSTPTSSSSAQESKPKPAPKKSKKNEDDGFGSFSIDSALGGGSSSASRSEFGSGSSVVASNDAKRVEKEIQESEPFVPPTSTFGGGTAVSTTSSSVPRSVSTSPRSSGPPKSSAPAEKPKVRRRRAVRKQATPEPEPEPEPQNEKSFHQEEEEDFSDFSI